MYTHNTEHTLLLVLTEDDLADFYFFGGDPSPSVYTCTHTIQNIVENTFATRVSNLWQDIKDAPYYF